MWCYITTFKTFKAVWDMATQISYEKSICRKSDDCGCSKGQTGSCHEWSETATGSDNSLISQANLSRYVKVPDKGDFQCMRFYTRALVLVIYDFSLILWVYNICEFHV